MPAVVASYTTNTTSSSPGSTVAVAQPTGLAVGDLIVLLGSSEDSNINVFGTLTFPPDDYARIVAPNNNQDVQGCLYWKVCDGDETWPLTVTHSDNDYGIVWALRITGADSVTPINATGSWDGIGSNASSLTITEVTTTVADCLGIYMAATDGADVLPLTLSSSPGWSITEETNAPDLITANGLGAQFGTKTITAAGGSGAVTLDATGTDGFIGIQIAIAPSIVAPPNAPTGLVATDANTDGAVNLSWSHGGGGTPTDYIIEHSPDGATGWTVFSDGVSTATTSQVTGLTNDVIRYFRVKATNNEGTSGYSNTDSATPTFSAVPSFYGSAAIQVATSGSSIDSIPYPAATVAGQGALLSFWCNSNFTPQTPAGWTQVFLDVNAAGTGAVYARRLQGGDALPSISVGASAFSDAAPGGAVIQVYDGIVDSGTWWEGAAYQTGTSTAPDSATITTTDDDRLLVSLCGISNDAAYPTDWTTMPAAGWTNNATPQFWNFGGDGTMFSVSKELLTAGTDTTSSIGTFTNASAAYWGTVTVALLGGVGAPPTAPNAPVNLAATDAEAIGGGEVDLSWDVGGGGTPTDYIVEYDQGGGWTVFADGVSTGTTARVTGLTDDVSCDFRVKATNAVGDSGYSTTATATPTVGTTPSFPTNILVSYTNIGGGSVATPASPVAVETQPAHVGPFKDGSNLYFLAETPISDTGSQARSALYKSTDRGSTWTLEDAAGTTDDLEAASVWPTGITGELMEVLLDGDQDDILSRRWGMASHSTPDSLIDTTAVTVDDAFLNYVEVEQVSVHAYGTEDLLAAYTRPNGSDTFDEIWLSWYDRSLNTWSTPEAVDQEASTQFNTVQVVGASDGTTHIVYADLSDNLWHREYTAGVLSARQKVNTNSISVITSDLDGGNNAYGALVGVHHANGVLHVVWYCDGSTGGTAGTLYHNTIADGQAPGATPAQVSTRICSHHFTSLATIQGPNACLVGDGNNLYVLFGDATSRNLYVAEYNGTAWQTETQHRALDLMHISAGLLEWSGSDRVIGIIMEDANGGTPAEGLLKYDEYALATPAATVDLADATTPGDTASVESSYVSGLADTSTPSDSVAVVIDSVVGISETLVPADTVVSSTSVARTSVDASAPTDVVAIVADTGVHVVDGSAPSDALSLVADKELLLSDTGASSDSLIVSASETVVLADAVVPADALSVAVETNLTLSDTSVPTDTLSVSTETEFTLADASAPSDALSVVAEIELTLTDTTSPGDSLVASASEDVVLSDTSVPADALSVSTETEFTLTDASAPLDVLSATTETEFALVDSSAPTDSISASASESVQLADASSPTDVVQSDSDIAFAIVDVSTPSDALAATAALVVAVADTSIPADVLVGGSEAEVSLADVSNGADSLANTIDSARSLDDLLTPTDLLIRQEAGLDSVSHTDSLSASDFFEAAQDAVRPPIDALTPTDSTTVSWGTRADVVDNLNPSDSVVVEVQVAADLVDALNPSDTLSASMDLIVGLADNSTPSDIPAVDADLIVGLTDTLNPSDVEIVNLDSVVGLVEITTPSDALVDTVESSRLLVDDGSPGDVLNTQVDGVDSVALSENVVAADSIVLVVDSEIVLGDSLNPIDTITATSDFGTGLADISTPSDTLTDAVDSVRALVDNAVLGDTFNLQAAGVDSIVLGENVIASDELTRVFDSETTIADSSTSGDAVVAATEFVVALDDSTTPNDGVSSSLDATVAISDAEAFSDTVNIQAAGATLVGLTESVIPNDDVALATDLHVVLGETSNPTDLISTPVLLVVDLSDSVTPTDSLGLEETAAADTNISDTIAPTDSVVITTETIRVLDDTATPGDTLIAEEAGVDFANLAEILSPSDWLEIELVGQQVLAETVTPGDSITTDLGIVQSVQEFVTPTDSLQLTHVALLDLAENVVPSDTFLGQWITPIVLNVPNKVSGLNYRHFVSDLSYQHFVSSVSKRHAAVKEN